MPQTTGTAVLFSLRIVFLSHPSPWGQRLVPSSRCMNNAAVCLTQGVGGECQDLGLPTKSRAHRYKIPGNSPPPAPTTQQPPQYTHISQWQTVHGWRPSPSLRLTNYSQQHRANTLRAKSSLESEATQIPFFRRNSIRVVWYGPVKKSSKLLRTVAALKNIIDHNYEIGYQNSLSLLRQQPS